MDSDDVFKSLEQRIAAIEARNHAVSSEKAWEISNARCVIICVITYVTTLIAFVIPQSNWYLAAFVPVLGYWLSTLSLPWLKKNGNNVFKRRIEFLT